MKTNTEAEKSLKKSQHDVQQKGNKLHMSEMLQILKGAYMSRTYPPLRIEMI